jgi:hypothetical protein
MIVRSQYPVSFAKVAIAGKASPVVRLIYQVMAIPTFRSLSMSPLSAFNWRCQSWRRFSSLPSFRPPKRWDAADVGHLLEEVIERPAGDDNDGVIVGISALPDHQRAACIDIDRGLRLLLDRREPGITPIEIYYFAILLWRLRRYRRCRVLLNW